MLNLINFPPQRLSFKDKIKDDYEWAKNVVRKLVVNYTHNRTSYNKLASNYDLYNNKVNQGDFDHYCNQLGLSVGIFPEIEAYNKTYNKINVVLSEELNRAFEFKAILVNDDGIKTKMLEYHQQLQGMVQQYIGNIFQQMGYGQDEATTQGLNNAYNIEDEMAKLSETKFLSTKEISANKLLNYMYRVDEIKMKKNDTFKHALISGMEVVWVGVVNDKPTVEVINPLGFFYHKAGDTKFFEDGLFAGYVTYMTVGDVLNKYGDRLTPEEVERVENYSRGIGSPQAGPTDSMRYYHELYNPAANHMYDSPQQLENAMKGQYEGNSTMNIKVSHIEWQSEKKVGFLTTITPEGDVQEDIVSEDFKLPAYATKSVVYKKNRKIDVYQWDNFMLYWDWIPEVWEAVQIWEDIFPLIGPKDLQYRSLNNVKKVRLGYHGVIYSNMNSESVSLLDRMKPFQYLYFILVHKLKKMIALDKPAATAIDTTMIDPEIGMEKTLYYLEELGLDFYNPLHNGGLPGAAQRGKITNVTNRSTMQHIMNYVQLMEAIDQQIADVAGINKQREGQVAPTEAVTNVQRQIQQSSIVTELYFQLHFKVWERVLGSLIELAKVTWKDSKILQYILDDMSIMSLEFNPDELLDTDFGVFLTNSSKEHMVFNELRQLGLTLIQNDKIKLSDLINILTTDSLEKLKTEIVHSEKKQQQEMAQQQQQQMEQVQAQIASQEKQKQEELDAKLYMHESKLENDRYIAEITSFIGQADQDSDDNGKPDQLEIEKFKLDKKKHEDTMEIKKEELGIKRMAAKKKPSTK